MAILDQVRDHIETDLPDDALMRLIDEAVREVEERFGTDSQVITDIEPGDGGHLWLGRPALTVTSVQELSRGVVASTIDAADYVLRFGGRAVELYGWVRRPATLRVTYTPRPEADIRDRVVIDLVKLSLTYDGMIHAESVGDYSASGSVTPDAYMRERENVLATISNRRGFRFR